MKEKKVMAKGIRKSINFVPEDIQIILSSPENSGKYNEREVLYIKG